MIKIGISQLVRANQHPHTLLNYFLKKQNLFLRAKATNRPFVDLIWAPDMFWFLLFKKHLRQHIKEISNTTHAHTHTPLIPASLEKSDRLATPCLYPNGHDRLKPSSCDPFTVAVSLMGHKTPAPQWPPLYALLAGFHKHLILQS